MRQGVAVRLPIPDPDLNHCPRLLLRRVSRKPLIFAVLRVGIPAVERYNGFGNILAVLREPRNTRSTRKRKQTPPNTQTPPHSFRVLRTSCVSWFTNKLVSAV